MKLNRKFLICRSLSAAFVCAAVLGCQSLDRKYPDGALLIVKVDLKLNHKSPVQSLRLSTPKFRSLYLTRLPAEENEPIRHYVEEDSYYIFNDLAAGNYSLKYGHVVLRESMPLGRKANGRQATQMEQLDAMMKDEGQEGAIAEWVDENQQLAATEALPDGVHYMGRFQVDMKFKFVTSLYPEEIKVSGEKTEAGERAAFDFLLSEWPSSPWAPLVPKR